jgi:tRNA (adenine37-N6)-methyltransferase
VWTIEPIGVVRSPFSEKAEAPRQPVVAEGIEGQILVDPRFEDALADLDAFDRIWVLFWFDRAAPHFRSRVLPPRSETKRGVFATRSPHRPNPIGMSAVRLDRIEGGTLFVRDLDVLDGTPVLDLKPYLPYADAFPDAGAGWLAEDPRPSWTIRVEPAAEAAMAWIVAETGLALRARVVSALSLGPKPHAYRRIRGTTLAVKEWRVLFSEEPGRVIVVTRVTSGFRPRELAQEGPVALVHRAFEARFSGG